MRRAALLLLAALTGGCLQTTYRNADRSGEPPSMLERRVTYRLAAAFWSTAPDCAAVLAPGPAPHSVTGAVEQAVERHLALRMNRVIGGPRVRQAEARLALDLRNAGDRGLFARRLDCDSVLEIRLREVSDDYAVLWARRAIGLTLALRRARDGELLWTATHTASRSDGGLPLSILSLPVSAARAAAVTGDGELFASIADDAVRRMVMTLPDTRGAVLSRRSGTN
jgi:hypothetical protein